MMVKVGNWLFHYRNFLFPVFYLALFIPSRPFLSNENASEIAGLLLIFSGILVRCITIGLVYIVMNLFIDIAQTIVDPRRIEQ